jgi:D-cysteine desulfhydrase
MQQLLDQRIVLAHLPTPLQPLPRLSAELGVELWVKRDDLTESIASGNKIRKLEYLLHDARQQGADTLVSCGGVQSNHCRAVAWAAARLGLGCTLLLRGEAPALLQGNLLLDRLLGAATRFIPREAFAGIGQIQADVCRQLAAAGRRPYWIPMGGSNATGSLGYVRMAAEVQAGALRPDHVYTALGSGGTFAGLWLGWRHFDLPGQLHGIAVCDDRTYFVGELERIGRELRAGYGIAADFDGCAAAIDDGHIGRGYALNTPDELATLVDVARREGLVLDPVYTLKAFLGMLAHVRQGVVTRGQRVLFIHSGGHAGIYPKAEELMPLLAAGAPG